METNKKKSNFWWPDVSTLDGARDAAKGGAAAAVMVAVVTTGLAIYAAYSSPVWGVITPWSFVDAGLFAAIAFGIWRLSRFAAVAGLALYLIEQASMFMTLGPKNPVMALLFILFFVGGVRGTFGYHKLRKLSAEPTSTN
jgi:hypothetical protein